VRINPETRHPAVNHQLDISEVVPLTARKGLCWIKEQCLEIVDKELHQLEDHIIGVGVVDVGGCFAQLYTGNCRRFGHLFGW